MRRGAPGITGIVWGQHLMTRLNAILFDLDDTLLGNDMDVFLSHYFPMVSTYVNPRFDQELFMRELLRSTQAMIADQDPDKTNREVFWEEFCKGTSIAQEEMEPFVNTFYEEQFGKMQKYTTTRPIASKIIQLCFRNKIKVVIATNPLFPLRAIEHRLDWAGIPVDQYDYMLVTAYENMHSAKPHQSYYLEILDLINSQPERTMMVGDDWDNDIVPASSLGMYTYLINHGDDVPLEHQTRISGHGSLENLYGRLNDGWLF